MKTITYVAALLWVGWTWTLNAQADKCRFLNEHCASPPSKPDEGPIKVKRSDAEHLQRCLTHHLQTVGPFRPEGQSDQLHLSKSDMIATCNFAIRNHNYYWDTLVANPDESANMLCCLRSQIDADTCRKNIEAAKSSGGFDFCKARYEQSDLPPKEWKVPAGCTSGPCLITPQYCDYVGYRREGDTSGMVAALRASMSQITSEAGRVQMRAVLRVCYGDN